MDKKVLVGLVMSIVEEVAKKHELEEAEARTLVGIALKRNREAVIAAVAVPVLSIEN